MKERLAVNRNITESVLRNGRKHKIVSNFGAQAAIEKSRRGSHSVLKNENSGERLTSNLTQVISTGAIYPLHRGESKSNSNINLLNDPSHEGTGNAVSTQEFHLIHPTSSKNLAEPLSGERESHHQQVSNLN